MEQEGLVFREMSLRLEEGTGKIRNGEEDAAIFKEDMTIPLENQFSLFRNINEM